MLRLLLIMGIFAVGFSAGAGYTQDKWINYYEPRIEWLSKELEGIRFLYWETVHTYGTNIYGRYN